MIIAPLYSHKNATPIKYRFKNLVTLKKYELKLVYFLLMC